MFAALAVPLPGTSRVVLASVIGLFWHSDTLQFVTSLFGVMVFAGLAACDARRLAYLAVVEAAKRRLVRRAAMPN